MSDAQQVFLAMIDQLLLTDEYLLGYADRVLTYHIYFVVVDIILKLFIGNDDIKFSDTYPRLILLPFINFTR